MIITNIQKRRGMVNALYVDNEFVANIDREVLQLCSYKIGSSIDQDDLYELIEKSDFRRAKEKALYLLEHRDYSKKELIDKILKTVNNKDAVIASVEKMEELGLIDDRKFAKKYTADLISIKKFSVKRIKYELIKKGIEKDIIEDTLEEIDVDPVDQIISIINKKYIIAIRNKKGRQKAILALQRYGYSWDNIRSALSNFPRIDSEDEY